MKLINNNTTNLSLLSLILVSFALGKCMAHPFKDTSPNMETRSTSRMAYPPEANQFSDPPEKPISFPPSEAPSPTSSSPSPSQDESFDGGSSSSSSSSSFPSSFSAAFTDILKGSLRDHSITMPHVAEKTKQSVENICAHTDYPDVCLATIPNFLSSHHFDVINVLEAAIKACSLQIKVTVTKVEKHAARSPDIADAVSECRNQYSNALGNLQRAMDAIPSRDLGTITVMLSAVMADVSTCESAFEDLKSSSSTVVSSTEGLVSITASNCLSIANLIPYN